ncbi:MAG: NAD-dependent epimerase/dehydratase family protein [Proteobacteria bacterium]|nr:NAD-dependent epimerase/dehydratase family protein [Pseudomonadota bacterium]MBW3617162.1 NAD-dependent epimerase/dehydratase family protein [Pseudomonadota bacterium]
MVHEGSSPARVLVLGATSLIGRFALPRLIAAGVSVRAVSRRPGGDGAELVWVQADIQAPDLVLPPAKAALSLSPIWLLPTALPALKRAGVTRLVAFSSTSRFTKAQSPEPEEREVARRLAEGEAALAAFCEAEGIGWTVLRPTLIYAEGHDANVSRMARLIARFGVFPLAGEGGGLRQPVHADDLATAAIEALRRPESLNRSYDLPGGETLTYRAMVVRIFHGLGRRPRILTVPPRLWRLGLELARSFLPGVNPAMGARMDADLAFDSAPALRDLGWRPRPFRPNFRAAKVRGR